jgi:uncharacterized protein YciI
MMKHFLVEIEYTAPLEIIDVIVGEHRKFLQTGYDQGWLLMSGPKIPKTGGIVIAQAPSMQEIQAFFFNDPYHLHQAATYNFVEFNPVMHQPFMLDWISGQ